MCRSPRLLSFRVQCEPCRDFVKFLCDELELERFAVETFNMAVLCFYGLLELLLEIFSYDIHYFTEAGLYCVINRIIDDCFVVRAESVHLFESTIAATHSGSED